MQSSISVASLGGQASLDFGLVAAFEILGVISDDAKEQQERGLVYGPVALSTKALHYGSKDFNPASFSTTRAGAVAGSKPRIGNGKGLSIDSSIGNCTGLSTVTSAALAAFCI